jgi:hypothetical protein
LLPSFLSPATVRADERLFFYLLKYFYFNCVRTG